MGMAVSNQDKFEPELVVERLEARSAVNTDGEPPNDISTTFVDHDGCENALCEGESLSQNISFEEHSCPNFERSLTSSLQEQTNYDCRSATDSFLVEGTSLVNSNSPQSTMVHSPESTVVNSAHNNVMSGADYNPIETNEKRKRKLSESPTLSSSLQNRRETSDKKLILSENLKNEDFVSEKSSKEKSFGENSDIEHHNTKDEGDLKIRNTDLVSFENSNGCLTNKCKLELKMQNSDLYGETLSKQINRPDLLNENNVIKNDVIQEENKEEDEPNKEIFDATSQVLVTKKFIPEEILDEQNTERSEPMVDKENFISMRNTQRLFIPGVFPRIAMKYSPSRAIKRQKLARRATKQMSLKKKKTISNQPNATHEKIKLKENVGKDNLKLGKTSELKPNDYKLKNVKISLEKMSENVLKKYGVYLQNNHSDIYINENCNLATASNLIKKPFLRSMTHLKNTMEVRDENGIGVVLRGRAKNSIDVGFDENLQSISSKVKLRVAKVHILKTDDSLLLKNGCDPYKTNLVNTCVVPLRSTTKTLTKFVKGVKLSGGETCVNFRTNGLKQCFHVSISKIDAVIPGVPKQGMNTNSRTVMKNANLIESSEQKDMLRTEGRYRNSFGLKTARIVLQKIEIADLAKHGVL